MLKRLLIISLLAIQVTYANMLAPNQVWHQIRQQPNRYHELIVQCDKSLSLQPKPSHSLAPLPHYTNHGERHTKSNFLSRDAWIAYRAGLCYHITHQSKYAHTASHFINAWTTQLKSVSTAQGKDDVNANFPAIIIAAFWLKGLNHQNDQHWQQFIKKQILPLSLAFIRDNNHADWGLLLNTVAGVYLDDQVLLQQSSQRWQDLVTHQINADGVFTQEICRSNTNNYCGGSSKGIKGLAYTHYAFLPLSITAQILSNNGYDVWHSPAGQRLLQAYKKVALWMRHPVLFPYYASNHGQLIGINNAAYFYILQHYFTDANATHMIKTTPLKMDSFQLHLIFHHP